MIAYFLENHEKKYKKPLSQIRFNLNSDNGFCSSYFTVTVADVDFMVEMGRSGYYPRTIIDQSKRVKIKYKKNNEVELYRIGPVGLVFVIFM